MPWEYVIIDRNGTFGKLCNIPKIVNTFRKQATSAEVESTAPYF